MQLGSDSLYNSPMIKTVSLNTRSSRERQALLPFQEAISRLGLRGYSTQSLDNRIVLDCGYFQFGDLRVDTDTRHIIVEVDHGGVTNLVKYWQCLETGLIKNPIVLIHLYRQNTPGDYASHIALWDFLNRQMHLALRDKFTAHVFTYDPAKLRADLAGAVALFENLL
jgi:hypothetical protein